jgi:predicted DCC family thiol-disulfide oxidoreductase YuxK
MTPVMDNTNASTLVLLYDGVCGFCSKTVRFVLDHDKRGIMRFAALQSDYGKAVIARHSILQNVDSVALLETSSTTGKERIFIRSTAALRIFAYLGGAWKLFLVAYIIPTSVRDFFYDLFARYRYKIFGKYDSCLIPSKEVGDRFLDLDR